MVRRCFVTFQCRGVLLIWIIVGQGPVALAVGAGAYLAVPDSSPACGVDLFDRKWGSTALSFSLSGHFFLSPVLSLLFLPLFGRREIVNGVLLRSAFHCLDMFSLICPFSPLSPSLWETARYRLKFLKGPLNPKQPTNQPTSH